MTAEVDICNMALSHLGDEATLVSIEPPEGSPQADHCARFYPLARDTLLASHPWSFATRTCTLAMLSSTPPNWQYAYALPDSVIYILNVISNGDEIDSFSRETGDDGKEILLCNSPNVSVRYTKRTIDTTLFSPLFINALSWKLASLLAGPMLSGLSGTNISERCEKMAYSFIEQAKAADSRQQAVTQTYVAPWVKVRYES